MEVGGGGVVDVEGLALRMGRITPVHMGSPAK